MKESYQLEDLREFYIRRQFFCNGVRVQYFRLTPEEYQQLKNRTLKLESYRLTRIRAFMDGFRLGAGQDLDLL